MKLELFVTANSPGEINGWVSPFVRELKARLPESHVTLLVPPCQYASGRELAVARSFPGIDRALGLGAFLGGVLLSHFRRRGRPNSLRRILFLGGDLAYALLLGKWFKAPVFAYSYRPRASAKVHRYLVPSEEAARRLEKLGIHPSRISVVGHLALDSVPLPEGKRKGPNVDAQRGLKIAFFVGSRPFEAFHGLPFFLEVASLLAQKHPGLEGVFPLAPTIADELILESLSRTHIDFTRISSDEPGLFGSVPLPCNGRALLFRNENENFKERLLFADFAVALPGTNNLQIASFGVPFLMVLPLNRAEEIPLDGLLGLLSPKIPGVGFLKRRMILSRIDKVPLISMVNIVAGKRLVPELRGILSCDRVAAEVEKLLQSPKELEALSNELLTLTSRRGAAARIVDALLEEIP